MAHELRQAGVRGVKGCTANIMARAFTYEFINMRKHSRSRGKKIFLFQYGFPQAVFDAATQQWVVIGRIWRSGKIPPRMLEWMTSQFITRHDTVDDSEARELMLHAFRCAFKNRHTTTCPVRKAKKGKARTSASRHAGRKPVTTRARRVPVFA